MYVRSFPTHTTNSSRSHTSTVAMLLVLHRNYCRLQHKNTTTIAEVWGLETKLPGQCSTKLSTDRCTFEGLISITLTADLCGFERKHYSSFSHSLPSHNKMKLVSNGHHGPWRYGHHRPWWYGRHGPWWYGTLAIWPPWALVIIIHRRLVAIEPPAFLQATVFTPSWGRKWATHSLSQAFPSSRFWLLRVCKTERGRITWMSSMST